MSRFPLKIFFIGILFFLSTAAHAATAHSFGKGAGSTEIDSFAPFASHCSRIRDATGKITALQFNSTNGTCVFYIYGVVPSTLPSYQATITLYYMTTDTNTGRNVTFTVKPVAMVDHAATGASAERQALTTGTDFASVATVHLSRQVTSVVVNDVQIRKPNDAACDSACNNTELALRISEHTDTNIAADALYFLGYSIQWAH